MRKPAHRSILASPTPRLFLSLILGSVLGGCGGSGPELQPDGGTAAPDPDLGTSPDLSEGAMPPGAPAGVTASGGFAQAALLSWTAPASAGDAPIAGYVVTASPGGATATTAGPELGLLFKGLSGGTDYTFTVHATSAAGSGPESDPSASFTVAAGLGAASISGCGGIGKVTISSSPIAGAVSNNVYYGTAPGVGRGQGTKVSGVSFPWIDLSLPSGTRHYFVVTSVDANGDESVESNEVTMGPSATMQDVGFASGYSSSKISISDCFSGVADTLNGETRQLSGASTQLAATNYGNLFVDASNRRLYVTVKNKVLVWNNADTVDGDVAPDRVLSGASTGLSDASGVAVDVGRDRLYVADQSGAIRIWANASTVTGDVAPTATLSGFFTGFGTNLAQIFLDEAGDRLYISNSPATTASIVVFDTVSKLSGLVNKKPSRTIAVAGWKPRGVWVDVARDLLYVGSRETMGKVYVLGQAATTSGTVVPLRTLGDTLELDTTTTVQVANNVLYVFPDSATHYLQYADADAVDGTIAPSRSVETGVVNGAGFFVVPPIP